MCDSTVSSFSTTCTPTHVTNHCTTGTDHSEGILGSHLNVVCQIYHARGHSAIHCPNRYTPKPQSVLLAYATFNLVSVDV